MNTWGWYGITGGRRNGRAQMQRWAFRDSLALSGHVHVASHDGLWCVTGDAEQLRTLGPLWRKLRQPEVER